MTYPLDEIIDFEQRALHESTWQRGSDVVVTPESKLYSAQQVAAATSLPMYVLTHPKVREALGLPCIRVGKMIRFNIDEVMAWARRTTAEMHEYGIEDTSDPTEDRRSLLQAIGNLAA